MGIKEEGGTEAENEPGEDGDIPFSGHLPNIKKKGNAEKSGQKADGEAGEKDDDLLLLVAVPAAAGNKFPQFFAEEIKGGDEGREGGLMLGIKVSLSLFPRIGMGFQSPGIEFQIVFVQMIVGEVDIAVRDEAFCDQEIVRFVAGEGQSRDDQPGEVKDIGQGRHQEEASRKRLDLSLHENRAAPGLDGRQGAWPDALQGSPQGQIEIDGPQAGEGYERRVDIVEIKNALKKGQAEKKKGGESQADGFLEYGPVRLSLGREKGDGGLQNPGGTECYDDQEPRQGGKRKNE